MATSDRQVVVSYCHTDAAWARRLGVHLRPLVRQNVLDLWDDTRIAPGTDWREEIAAAFGKARVAVLLVSADFIASDFVVDNELPPLLRRAQSDGVLILPIIVGHSLFSSQKELSRYQCVNPPEQPLSGMSTSEADRVLVAAARAIESHFRRDRPTAASPSTAPAMAIGARRLRRALWPAAALMVVGMIAAMVHFWPPSTSGAPPRDPTGADGEPELPADRPALPTVTSGSPTATGRGNAVAAAPARASRCPPGMAYLAAGTFRMGSGPDDKDADANERPARDVTLSAFCLDVAEATVARYRQCVGEARNGARCLAVPAVEPRDLADLKFRGQLCNGDRTDRDSHPINCVDWTAADTYCKWAKGALPTEAQWEYAARGSRNRRYPWGNEPPGPSLLNACGDECRETAKKLGRTVSPMYEGDDGDGTTAPVKSHSRGATPEGIFDMAGNVSEWVQDIMAGYDRTLARDPVQTAGKLRILRGGGWDASSPRSVRAATRDGLGGDYHLNNVGFRCAGEPIQ